MQASHWRRLLLLMLSETDRPKLELAATALEEAIFVRYQELGNAQGPVATQERHGLKEARYRLVVVRTKKLGYPA